MADTPEKRVKNRIDAVLKAAPECFYSKPVVTPLGVAMLDYVGCSKGRYFEIEAKAANKQPTERQWHRMEQVRAAGGAAFVINEHDGLVELQRWLHG